MAANALESKEFPHLIGCVACLVAFTLMAGTSFAQSVVSIGTSVWADHDYPVEQHHGLLSSGLSSQFAERISKRLRTDTVNMQLVEWTDEISRAHPFDWESADWRCTSSTYDAQDYTSFHRSLPEMGECLAENFRSEAYRDFYSRLMPAAGVDMIVEVRSFSRCPQAQEDEGSCFYGAAVVLVEKAGQVRLVGTGSQEFCCGTTRFASEIFTRPEEFYARLVQPLEDKLGPELISAIRRLP